MKMTLFQALALAAVQGLTEFLPISSSGHLVFFQKLFHLSHPPVFFDVLLHFATLIAILIFFRRRIFQLVKNWKVNLRIWQAIALGSVPAALSGIFFNSYLEKVFDSLVLVGLAWLFFGSLLLLGRRFGPKSPNYSLKTLEAKDSLLVGIFQAVALIPGVSRSGSTIFAGLWRRLTAAEAFEFSFLLAIPAILGATLLELKDVTLSQINPFREGLAVLTAAFIGYFSLVFLQKLLRSEKFYYFGFYCLALGLLSLALTPFF